MPRLSGDEALSRFIELSPDGQILDIGSGAGAHAGIMRDAGLDVLTIDNDKSANIISRYQDTEFSGLGGVWCSHVLEHQTNPGRFLQKIACEVTQGGWIAITVPHNRHDLVGGHVSIWTDTILIYHLLLAGIRCDAARVGIWTGQLSVIVQNIAMPDLPLGMCNGDIETLRDYFPWPVTHGDHNQQGPVSWD